MHSLKIRKGELIGTIVSKNDHLLLNDIYKLRHDVFVKKLKWVDVEHHEHEIDQYDKVAVQFAVVINHKVVGTLRAISGDNKFMLDEEFKHLVLDIPIKKNSSIEVSRLAIDPEIKDKKLKRKVAVLLYELARRWAKNQNVRYIYLVSLDKIINSLNKRYGNVVRMFEKNYFTSDGHSYRAAVIDTKDLNKFIVKIMLFVAFYLS